MITGFHGVATDSSHRVTMKKKKERKKNTTKQTNLSTLEPLHFYWLFILAGNHNTSMCISKEFDFVPDSMPLEHLENVPMYSLCYCNNFVFTLAGNKDNHTILDEFEIQSDPTTDCRGTCSWPLALKNGENVVNSLATSFVIKPVLYCTTCR